MATDPIVEQLANFTACVLQPAGPLTSGSFSSLTGLLTFHPHFCSCDVADALLKLKFPNGGFLAGITLWSPERQAGPTKIVGPVYTVKYAPLSDVVKKVESHYVRLFPLYTFDLLKQQEKADPTNLPD